MANVQTRRSISFALADYEAAQALAIAMGIPLAQLAAQALREFLVRNRPLPPLPDLQPELDNRVGVLPREPFTVADVRRAVGALSKPENQAPRDGFGNVVINVEHGSLMDQALREGLRTDHLPVRRVEVPATWSEIAMIPADEMDGPPDTMAGPRAIEHADPFAVVDEAHTLRGIAHRMDKMAEADHPDAGEVRVVYDEEL